MKRPKSFEMEGTEVFEYPPPQKRLRKIIEVGHVFTDRIIPFFDNKDFDNPRTLSKKIETLTILSPKKKLEQILSSLKTLRKKVKERIPSITESFARECLPTDTLLSLKSRAFVTREEVNKHHKFIFREDGSLERILDPKGQELDPNKNLFLGNNGYWAAKRVKATRDDYLNYFLDYIDTLFRSTEKYLQSQLPREEIYRSPKEILSPLNLKIESLEEDVAHLLNDKKNYVKTLDALKNRKSDVIDELEKCGAYSVIISQLKHRGDLERKLETTQDTDSLIRSLPKMVERAGEEVDVKSVKALLNAHKLDIETYNSSQEHVNNIDKKLDSLHTVLKDFKKREITKEALGKVIKLSNKNEKEIRKTISTVLEKIKPNENKK